MSVLEGFIRDVRYLPHLTPAPHPITPLDGFDVNQAKATGLVNLGSPGNHLAYARWVSPKRTRSYPFARLYDIFHYNNRKVAIIPIIKDEGADSANNDRINAMTFSWMSLLDIFIVLAWYDDAVRKPGVKNLITRQRLNAAWVRDKLTEISQYHLSALHWNTSHFQRDFETVYREAVDSYRQIAARTDVTLHSPEEHLRVLDRYLVNERFNLDAFRVETLLRSQGAARREIQTTHRLESLADGDKTLLSVSNYLGGTYYLAPDEVYFDGSTFVLQESKNNSRGRFPSISDLKDGLFKLILYANLTELRVDGQPVPFRARLRLTGGFAGTLTLPVDTPDLIDIFCARNRLTGQPQQRLYQLQQEAKTNHLTISLIGQLDTP